MQLTLADGGIETDLIFHHGQDLPEFAAFVLLDNEAGRAALRSYYVPYLRLASEHKLRLVLETPTWRASEDWLRLLGRPAGDVQRVNADAVRFVAAVRREIAPDADVMVSGCVGPRADGDPGPAAMTPDEARAYHSAQIGALAGAGVGRVAALTISYVAEAIGVVLAGRDAGVATVLSFTVETTGDLPDGTALGDAINQVDELTGRTAESFMVNCAHPSHIARALAARGDWVGRLSGVRANASTRSHAELDAADDLDEGDPSAFATQLLDLRAKLPALQLLGGCCGTDVRHIAAIARAVCAT